MAVDGVVLVVAEASGDVLRPASLELVTVGKQIARDLGGSSVALVIGSEIGSAARQIASAGVDRVLVADDPRLQHLPIDAITAIVTGVIQDVMPSVLLIPATTAGIEYGPRVAARLRLGMAADCIAFSVEDDSLIAVRPVLGGRVQTAVRFGPSRPQIASVRAGCFEQATVGDGGPDSEVVAVELTVDDQRIQVIGVAEKEQAGGVALEEADTIVGGGRGLKEPVNFALVEKLAAALGGAVAATRAVTDAGWRPHHEQVGQTGRSISPRLYIAVGISGAVQHLVGVQGSDYIVAINRDPDAPIFKIASFGIVGDLFDIVPAIINELNA